MKKRKAQVTIIFDNVCIVQLPSIQTACGACIHERGWVHSRGCYPEGVLVLFKEDRRLCVARNARPVRDKL